MPPFLMPPPNELLNENDIALDEIQYPPLIDSDGATTYRRIVYPYLTATDSDDLVSPALWHGRLFTNLCYECEHLVDALLAAEKNDWSLKSRNVVAVRVKNLFHQRYLGDHRNTFRWWWGETADQNDAERYGKLYIPLTADVMAIVRKEFDRALPYVVDWAMCSFSRWRDNWKLPVVDEAKVEIPDIMAVPLDNEFIINSTSKKRRSIKLSTERELTPEEMEQEMANRKMLSRLRRQVGKLKRAGKLNEAALDGLDENERWESDYVQ